MPEFDKNIDRAPYSTRKLAQPTEGRNSTGKDMVEYGVR
uniref:Uncharacterized protein n=1 Tax=Candidatus Kentrum sp. DK TaxID=2126562 RepID=A0A450S3U9_9GAMM|nr:MAG: hypothetical protein BECKDK2373B_GA0170837_101312 [Candidatus Kentron sp. DK]